jgi:DNA polymerase
MTTQAIKLWLDLETYSEVPITNGTHAYAAGAEIMLFAWALDDGPVSVLDMTTPESEQERDDWLAIERPLLDSSVEIWAHNSHFDRTVLRHALPRLHLTLERWRDTMVQALSHGLPGSLGQLGEVLKLPTDVAKDKEGRKFIQLFCKPRPFGHTLVREPGETLASLKERIAVLRENWSGRATRHTHPQEWARFVAYAGRDIEAMREAHKRMPNWNYKGAEMALWHLDQKINDRGVAIDMALVHR